MKTTPSLIAQLSVSLLLAALAVTVFASEYYIRGQISHKGRPAVDATVTVSCANGPTRTNSYGQFRADLRQIKGCSIIIVWDGRTSEELTLSKQHFNRFVNLNLQLYQDKWLIDIR